MNEGWFGIFEQYDPYFQCLRPRKAVFTLAQLWTGQRVIETQLCADGSCCAFEQSQLYIPLILALFSFLFIYGLTVHVSYILSQRRLGKVTRCNSLMWFCGCSQREKKEQQKEDNRSRHETGTSHSNNIPRRRAASNIVVGEETNRLLHTNASVQSHALAHLMLSNAAAKRGKSDMRQFKSLFLPHSLLKSATQESFSSSSLVLQLQALHSRLAYYLPMSTKRSNSTAMQRRPYIGPFHSDQGSQRPEVMPSRMKRQRYCLRQQLDGSVARVFMLVLPGDHTSVSTKTNMYDQSVNTSPRSASKFTSFVADTSAVDAHGDTKGRDSAHSDQADVKTRTHAAIDIDDDDTAHADAPTLAFFDKSRIDSGHRAQRVSRHLSSTIAHVELARDTLYHLLAAQLMRLADDDSSALMQDEGGRDTDRKSVHKFVDAYRDVDNTDNNIRGNSSCRSNTRGGNKDKYGNSSDCGSGTSTQQVATSSYDDIVSLMAVMRVHARAFESYRAWCESKCLDPRFAVPVTTETGVILHTAAMLDDLLWLFVLWSTAEQLKRVPGFINTRFHQRFTVATIHDDNADAQTLTTQLEDASRTHTHNTATSELNSRSTSKSRSGSVYRRQDDVHFFEQVMALQHSVDAYHTSYDDLDDFYTLGHGLPLVSFAKEKKKDTKSERHMEMGQTLTNREDAPVKLKLGSRHSVPDSESSAGGEGTGLTTGGVSDNISMKHRVYNFLDHCWSTRRRPSSFPLAGGFSAVVCVFYPLIHFHLLWAVLVVE